MKTERIGIIGLDKVSGSIGLALRQAGLGLQILGADTNRDALSKAKKLALLDKASGKPQQVAREADILVLSVSVAERVPLFRSIGPVVQEHTLLVDLTALKGAGLELAGEHLPRGHYVGASPVLAAAALSDGRTDITAARADLFENSVFCIMPSETVNQEAVKTTVALGRIIGATPFFMDPYEYDGLMQGVEAMPGLVSAAMFRAVTGAAGWRDMLRIAGSTLAESTAGLDNHDLAGLAYHDRAAALRWLDAVLGELQDIRRWLVDGDRERMALILEETAVERARWLEERRQNKWLELESFDDARSFSVTNQMLGLAGRRQRDKK